MRLYVIIYDEKIGGNQITEAYLDNDAERKIKWSVTSLTSRGFNVATYVLGNNVHTYLIDYDFIFDHPSTGGIYWSLKHGLDYYLKKEKLMEFLK